MKITALEDNDLVIYQGGTLDRRYIVYDEETGALADLTGYTGECTVSTAAHDDAGTVLLTPTVVVDTVNSVVQVYEDTTANTRAVPRPASGYHRHATYITGASGDRWCVAFGVAAVALEPAHA